MKSVKVIGNSGQHRDCHYDKEPDLCPICHFGIDPISFGTASLTADGSLLQRVFRCPLSSCSRLFIGLYYKNNVSGYFFLKNSVPTELQDTPLAAELKTISPDFCDIYNQSHKAEQHGLLLVSGPGYRKALEFLIKDYLSSLQATDEAKKDISDLPLMACIKKYVRDDRMLTTAERAAWLGNDETHYVRKWEDKDLQDLKNLIQLTCYWIQSEHLTNAARISMPQGKK